MLCSLEGVSKVRCCQLPVSRLFGCSMPKSIVLRKRLAEPIRHGSTFYQADCSFPLIAPGPHEHLSQVNDRRISTNGALRPPILMSRYRHCGKMNSGQLTPGMAIALCRCKWVCQLS